MTLKTPVYGLHQQGQANFLPSAWVSSASWPGNALAYAAGLTAIPGANALQPFQTPSSSFQLTGASNPASAPLVVDGAGRRIENGQTVVVPAALLWPTPGYVLGVNDPRWSFIDNTIAGVIAKYAATSQPVNIRLRIMAGPNSPYHWVNLCGTARPDSGTYSPTTVAQYNGSSYVSDPASGSPGAYTVSPSQGSTSYTGGGVAHYWGNYGTGLASSTSPTTVAAGSNGVNLSTFTGSAVLNVTSIAGLPTSGTATITALSATITYTGISGLQLTGCTLLSGSGTLSTGQAVTTQQISVTAGSVTTAAVTTASTSFTCNASFLPPSGFIQSQTLGFTPGGAPFTATGSSGAYTVTITAGAAVTTIPTTTNLYFAMAAASPGDWDAVNGVAGGTPGFSRPTYLPAMWDPAFYTNYIACMKQVIARYDNPAVLPAAWGGVNYSQNITEIQLGGMETQYCEPFTNGTGYNNKYNAANQSSYLAAGYQEIFKRYAWEQIITQLTAYSQRTRLNFWLSNNWTSCYDSSLSSTTLIHALYGMSASLPGYHAFGTTSAGYTSTPANPTYGWPDTAYTTWICSTLNSAYGYKVMFGGNNLGNGGNTDSGVSNAGPSLYANTAAGYVPQVGTGQSYLALASSGAAIVMQTTGSGANAGGGGSGGGGNVNSMINSISYFAGNNPAWYEIGTDGSAYMLGTSLECDPGILTSTALGGYAPNYTQLTASNYLFASTAPATIVTPITVAASPANKFTVSGTVVTVAAGTYTTVTALAAAINAGLVSAGLQTKTSDVPTSGFAYSAALSSGQWTFTLYQSGSSTFTCTAVGSSLTPFIPTVASITGPLDTELPGSWAYLNQQLITNVAVVQASEGGGTASATWPTLTMQADWAHGPNAGTYTWSNLNDGTHTVVTAFQTRRGRQYELNTIEVGTCSIAMTDFDEYLNPANTASPWNTGGNTIKPYRPVQILASWAGTTFGVFSGFYERAQLQWDQAGFLGARTLDAVDGLGLLNRKVLKTAPVEMVTAAQPSRYMTCGDQVGATSLTDITGSAIWPISGPTTLAATSPAGSWDATTWLTASASSSNPTLLSAYRGGSDLFISAQGPGPGYAVNWQLSFAISMANASGSLAWRETAGGNSVSVTVGASLTVSDGTHTLSATPASGTFYDGLPHVVTVTSSSTGPSTIIYVDGVQAATQAQSYSTTGSPQTGQWTLSNCSVAHLTYNFQASTALSTIAANIAAAILTGFAGDTTDQRIVRLLTAAGYVGYGVNVQSGASVEYAAQNWQNQTAKAVADICATDEDGLLFCDGSGILQYHNRNTRHNPGTLPVSSFGEGNANVITYYGSNSYGTGLYGSAPAIEIPYTISTTYSQDPQYVYTEVATTQPDGIVAYSQNASSYTDYGDLVLRLQTHLASDLDAAALGQWIAAKWAGEPQPALRLQSIQIDAAANPQQAFPVILALEIGNVVQVSRRPPQGGTIFDLYTVESIAHDVAAGKWQTTLELAPAALLQGFVVDQDAVDSTPKHPYSN